MSNAALEADMQHLDEGTIHAWLDGALAPNEASAAEAHVQACAQCANAVAEARGLVAASSRILAALDDIPALQQPLTLPVARRRSGWSWRRAGVSYAAAATLLLAVGTTIVWRYVSPNAALDSAPAVVDESQRLVEPAASLPDSSALVFRPAPPTQRSVTAQSEGAAGASPASSVARSKNAKEAEAPKEELAVDKIVPLTGAMPRPAAPTPPAVRQEAERKAVVDRRADASAFAAHGALVQGRVLDAATGAPVVGAVVSVDTARMVARTDSAGKFKLQAVPLGQQTVSVRASGFELAQHQVAIVPRDSIDLGFTLQKSGLQADQNLQVERARQARGGQASAVGLRDSLLARRQVATPILRLDGVRANAENILGCYELRAAPDKKDADEARSAAAAPARVQLEAQARERAQANEPLVNRARTLEGPGRAESWRFVGDSLELTWMDGARRRVLRFARSDVNWVAQGFVLQRCETRP